MSEPRRCSCGCPQQVGTYMDDQGHLHIVSVVCLLELGQHGVRDFSDEGNWELVARFGPFGEAASVALDYLVEQTARFGPITEGRRFGDRVDNARVWGRRERLQRSSEPPVTIPARAPERSPLSAVGSAAGDSSQHPIQVGR